MRTRKKKEINTKEKKKLQPNQEQLQKTIDQKHSMFQTDKRINFHTLKKTFNHSLLYQSFKVMIELVILLVAWFFFFYLTRVHSYISFNVESSSIEITDKSKRTDFIVEEIVFEAKRIDVQGQTDHQFIIDAWNKGITLNTYRDMKQIEECTFDRPYLIFTIIPTNSQGYIRVYPKINRTNGLYVPGLEDNKNLYCRLADFSSNSFELFKSNLVINGSSTMQRYLFSSSSPFSITGNSETEIVISGCVVQVSDLYNTTTYSSDVLLSITIPPNNEFGINCSIDSNWAFSDISNLKAEISGIKNLSLFGDGQIVVTYTADSKEYTANEQPVYFDSNDSSLSFDITQENVKNRSNYFVTGYGYVDKALLSNISLLPSIINWFKENVYVLPASFITVILGSIKLIELEKSINDDRKFLTLKTEQEDGHNGQSKSSIS